MYSHVINQLIELTFKSCYCLFIYFALLTMKESKGRDFQRHFWSLFSFFGLLQSTIFWGFSFNLIVYYCWLFLQWSYQRSLILILVLIFDRKLFFGCIQIRCKDFLPPQSWGSLWQDYQLGIDACWHKSIFIDLKYPLSLSWNNYYFGCWPMFFH